MGCDLTFFALRPDLAGCLGDDLAVLSKAIPDPVVESVHYGCELNGIRVSIGKIQKSTVIGKEADGFEFFLDAEIAAAEHLFRQLLHQIRLSN